MIPQDTTLNEEAMTRSQPQHQLSDKDGDRRTTRDGSLLSSEEEDPVTSTDTVLAESTSTKSDSVNTSSSNESMISDEWMQILNYPSTGERPNKSCTRKQVAVTLLIMTSLFAAMIGLLLWVPEPVTHEDLLADAIPQEMVPTAAPTIPTHKGLCLSQGTNRLWDSVSSDIDDEEDGQCLGVCGTRGGGQGGGINHGGPCNDISKNGCCEDDFVATPGEMTNSTNTTVAGGGGNGSGGGGGNLRHLKKHHHTPKPDKTLKSCICWTSDDAI